MTPADPVLGAVLLAGGRATRLDGAVKPLLDVGGRSLLGRAVDAAHAAHARPVMVAAPVLDASLDVEWVREDPPFGGPVAGIVAALTHPGLAQTEWTLVLACDLARPDLAVARLLSDLALLPGDTEGLCLADASSRPQWLTGVYRTAALRAAARGMRNGGRNAPVRELLDELAIAVIAASDHLTADVDTWQDLERARAAAASPPPSTEQAARISGGVMTEASRTLPPEALDAWAAAMRERFGLADGDVPISLILDLARDVANGVARPAAPLSAFVAGLVAGRAGGTPADVESAVAAVVELAQGWEA
ncbi:NTP transferase domain-containing protein [Microbacterium sp. F51-2R]|uniref:NTP transferase domain-containing protein n=1 Tax=Microbacterium sp. F51-2R TaxID=3445777 RepID=UPI003FA10208